jgi:signal transduction histidine kinase
METIERSPEGAEVGWDPNGRLARAIMRAAPEIAREWARRMHEQLQLDLSPYPDPDDPRLIRGIAACLGESRTSMVCTMELMERARQIGEVAEAKGISAEQVLNGSLILDELLWELAQEELAAGPDGEQCAPVVASCRRLHDAVMVVVRATTGAYLHRYRGRIRQDAERMRSFNRMVSHELKNPISAVQGAVALLVEEGAAEDPAMRERYLAMVRRNTTRMVDLVDDLLTLSTTERTDAVARQEPIDLGELFIRIQDRLSDDAEEKGVQIEHGPLPEVMADRASLELVLTNLISNAIRYSDPNKPARYVRVSANQDRADGWIVLVEDNGFGIAPEAQPRVFERFFRAAADRKISGTGLGLSIVQEVVERWGGRVWLESEEGAGSTFFLTIPT